ncbi:MAG: DNA polymerase III subunit delta [Candidatus Dormiibacterota bacterium]
MVEPLVLVHGDDPFLVTSAALRRREELTRDMVSELGMEEFRASRDLDAISRSLSTPPFLGVRRLVVIWDPPQIGGAQRSAQEAQSLADILGTRLETTAVLVVSRGTIASGSPLIKAVRSQEGEVQQLKRPRGRELRQYVETRLRERGLKLGPSVLSRLVEVGGQDLGRLDQELEKLSIYVAGSAAISDADALLLVPPAPPTELYRLTDSLFESPGRVGERLGDLEGRSDIPPPMVVGAVARVLRDLIAFANVKQGGAGSSLPPWREDKLRAHLKRAGEPRLRRWLVELADLDWATRTGAVDGRDGLDLQMARMATELSARPQR